VPKTKYTIQLEQSKRDEWADFVDSSDEFSTTSELIRRSVKEFIQRAEVADSDGFSKEQKEIIETIETQTDHIITDLDDLESVLDTISDSQTDEEEQYEIVYQATREALKAHEQGDDK
jgi:Arc/MetJ-type ribon-helix-helix transcriptional regulator